MTFAEALKLPNAEFKLYVEQVNKEFRERMRSQGMVYFPDLDRWYPKGTEISGAEPEPEP